MSRLWDPVRRSRVSRPVVYSLIEYHLSRFHRPTPNVDFSPDPDHRASDEYAGIEYAGLPVVSWLFACDAKLRNSPTTTQRHRIGPPRRGTRP
jgi:hypothetical protein